MGSILTCLKPVCLSGNKKQIEPERRHEQCELHKEKKKEWLLKNDKMTLQDYILSSPRSPATSNKRVYPNPDIVNDGDSNKRRLLEGQLNARIDDVDGGGNGKSETKIEENLLSKGERIKKKVSFRMPEIADVFILVDSPITLHESTEQEVYDHY